MSKRVYLICSYAALVSACTGEPQRPGSVHADSAGIDVATQSGTDGVLDWTWVDRFELGGRETDAESFYRLGGGALIGADTLGHLYILDGDAHRILVFDSTGAPVRRMGGEGGGPGEFSRALAFSVGADGTSAVFDLGKRSLVRFDREGGILAEMRTPPTYFGGSIVLGSGTLTIPTQHRTGEKSSNQLTVASEQDTTVIASIEQSEFKAVQLKSCGMGFSGMPPVFTPTLRWTGAGARTLVVLGASYEITEFDGERPVRIIRRGIAPAVATEALAIREQGDGMRVMAQGGLRVCEPADVVEQLGVADVIPAIKRLTVDPDGRIWVERGHVRDEPAVLDVFDRNGDYLGTLPAGFPYPAAFLSATRIVTVVKDEFDVERAVIRDIVESSN